MYSVFPNRQAIPPIKLRYTNTVPLRVAVLVYDSQQSLVLSLPWQKISLKACTTKGMPTRQPPTRCDRLKVPEMAVSMLLPQVTNRLPSLSNLITRVIIFERAFILAMSCSGVSLVLNPVGTPITLKNNRKSSTLRLQTSVK